MAQQTIGMLVDRSPAAANDLIEIERTVGGLQASGKVTVTSVGANVLSAASGSAARSAIGVAWEFVSTTPITAVANIDFTGLTSGFDYLFRIIGAVPNAAAVQIRARLSVATVFDTGNNYGGPGTAPSAQSFIPITNSTVNATAANGGVDVDVILRNPASTADYKKLSAQPIYVAATNMNSDAAGGGYFVQSAVDGIRFFPNGQSFQAVGRIELYKMANA